MIISVMKNYESIREAVKAAQSGDSEAYGYLYKKSYREKYYIALKYMRNDTDAEDVLSDAYLRAWEKLSTLENPDVFSTWLGQIVARTAINALNKKKPLLFSSSTNEEVDEPLIPDIPDERIDTQPELSYTTKERSEIIESMLDSLTDSQRLCVVMYYMEGMTAPEIADILECPVSTVKSRLKYAKDNLHKQADLLQKKGYNFYGIAPVPFFLYLLELDAAEQGAALSILAVGTASAGGFMASVGGKIVAGIIGSALVAGLTIGGVALRGDSTDVSTISAPTSTESPSQINTSKPDALTDTDMSENREISDDELQNLISGGLSKKDLEMLLLYAPAEMNGEMTKDEISNMIRGALLDAGDEAPPLIQKLAPDYIPEHTTTIKSEAINTFISAITDYHIEGKDTTLPDVPVVGDRVYIGGRNASSQAVHGKKIIWKECTIKSISLKNNEIAISYTRNGNLRVIKNGSYGIGEAVTHDQTALLKPEENGRFRIYRIIMQPSA